MRTLLFLVNHQSSITLITSSYNHSQNTTVYHISQLPTFNKPTSCIPPPSSLASVQWSLLSLPRARTVRVLLPPHRPRTVAPPLLQCPRPHLQATPVALLLRRRATLAALLPRLCRAVPHRHHTQAALRPAPQLIPAALLCRLAAPTHRLLATVRIPRAMVH